MCKNTHYIIRNGYECKERNHNPDNCKDKNKEEEECIECNANYFLSGTGVNSKCVVYPDGETGCEKWDAVDGTRKCVKCDETEYFMENGVCTKATAPDNNCI